MIQRLLVSSDASRLRYWLLYEKQKRSVAAYISEMYPKLFTRIMGKTELTELKFPELDGNC